MKEVIYYTRKVNAPTRDPLRTLSIQDRRYLIKVMTAILQLPECPDIPDGFCDWFDTANKHLPKQDHRHNYAHNSPRSFCQGIKDKLNQTLVLGDLSPRQCEGISSLMTLLSQGFDVPVIEFEEGTNIPTARSGGETAFATLFGKKKDL